MAVTSSIAELGGAVLPSRYEVVCRLNGGGMADLYLARATGLAGFERLVVIKQLSRQFAGRPEAVHALYDEARIAATLSHANIVQVTDVEIVDGQVSIVMEFLHGHDVAQLLRRMERMEERLPLDQAIAIGLSVCAGLHHAHERRGPDGQPLEIVHRDVSPHNVLVTYDGSVKIVDFGIARAATKRNQTEDGVIKGKPGYIAPEQLRGKHVDRRTDVWATGVLLYEMTTGTRPYGNDPSAMDQLVAVITRDPPPPSSQVSGYPPELEAIVMRAMSRDPAARYADAEALHQALEAFAGLYGLDLSPYRIAALMSRAFASRLTAWRSAQARGLSLAEHVAAFRTTRSIDAVDADDVGGELATGTGPPLEAIVIAPPPIESMMLPVRRRRWTVAVAAVLAVPLVALVALAGLAAWATLGSSHRAPRPQATAETPPPATSVPAGAVAAPAPRPDPAVARPVDLAAARPDPAPAADPIPDPAVAPPDPAIEMPVADPPTRAVTRPSRTARPIIKKAGRATTRPETTTPRPAAAEDLDAPLPR